MRVRIAAATLVALAVIGSAAAAPPRPRGAFVTRVGQRLVLAGRPFRFGGANVEWLGLIGYGPADPLGPRYPSHFEIDDALATVQELGGRVVRSQTMGDSVGCELCIEPALGRFNDDAFEPIDYALASAASRGLKIIATIVGDDARGGGSGCVYLRWRAIAVPDCSLINMAPFWTDPTVLGDVEAHIRAVLDHVNRYTGVAYKDDPTILGWDLLNGGGSPTPWTREISTFVRSIDRRHLILSAASNASLETVDSCVAFVYPHWSQPLTLRRPELTACGEANKPFIVYEYGWDVTNFPTLGALSGFLRTLENDPGVAGDAFWALQAHRDGHGWMPVPADVSNPVEARKVETGEWWALYYPGIATLVTTAQGMSARAQVIRAHDFAMAAQPVPPHRLPPAPTLTAIRGATVYWQGSAGARNYSVQRAERAAGPWTTICNRCVTDLSPGYTDASSTATACWYRVVPYNLDGRAGPPSKPRCSGAVAREGALPR